MEATVGQESIGGNMDSKVATQVQVLVFGNRLRESCSPSG